MAISAIAAFCLPLIATADGQAGSLARPSPAPPAATLDSWPIFRGDASLRGVAASALPERLEPVWRVSLPEAIESSAAIAFDTVFVGCDDSHLYALNLADGRERWKYHAGAEVRSSPTVYGERVYFGDEVGVLHVLDARSGKAIWTLKTEGSIYSAVNVADGRLLVGSYDGHLYCVDPADGRVIWKYETGDRVHGTPAISDGVAAIAGCDATLHLVDLATGEARDRIALGSVCGTAAATQDGWTWLGTHGNQVVGVDWSRKEVAWRFEDPERQFPFMSSAAVHEGVIFVGGRDRRFRAIDARSGSVRWTAVLRGRIDSSPVVAGGRVYFGASDGVVYGLDVASGEEVWRFGAGAGVTASPAVAGGRLVIGALDGVLYCFGARD